MSERQPEDATLVARTAAGDDEAFRMLVERHHRAIFRLAYRHLGSVADAEDVTQDTFHRLFEAARRYRPERPLRAYLFTIAARLCLKRNKRHDRSRTVPVAPAAIEASPGPSAGASPEEALWQKEREAAIRSALDELPADQRLALILLRYEEMSGEEIARVLDRSPAAVHSLLYRARGRMAELLQAAASLREVER
ncbi:MAG: sigma-70 family RNA polymerase sigma factor [Myxococcales bacterium]|nr:sigma-70 family RNA polymerase sigma factor [Myxococcales bacterium]